MPICPYCLKNHVKPDVTFFGEHLPDAYFDHHKDFPQCDLLIVCGTSLQVEPVCSLPQFCKPDIPCFLINKEKVKEKGGVAHEA